MIVSAIDRAVTTTRVIDSLGQIEEIRSIWSAWRGHRDADVDVYETVLASRTDAAKPHIIVVERDGCPDALLVGMTATATVGERIGYWTIPVPGVRVLSFQYGGFLGKQSEENSALIISQIEQSLRGGDADVAILSYVREGTPLHRLGTRVRSVMMRDAFPTNHSHSVMTLPNNVEEIYGGLSSEHRWRLRRDAKRFRAAFADLKISRFDCPEQLERLVRDAEQVAATTYQRGLGVGFSDSQPIRELLSLEARKRWLRAYLLYVGDRPCAFWIGCVYNGVFLSEYLGHDPFYAKYSPGTYLLTHVMEDLCRDSVTAIDFGIGGALYKQRFAGTTWQETEIRLYAPTWRGMRVKAIRAAAAVTNNVGKGLLERAHVADRIKKVWRRRAAHSQPRERN